MITMGDPSGVGPEIILKSLASRQIRRLVYFIVIGDMPLLYRVRDSLGLRVPLHCINNTGELRKNTVNVYDLKNVPQKDFKYGEIRKAFGRASMQYLEKALEIIKHSKNTALVTAPISKTAINMAGYRYGGHTEYLSKATNTAKFAMMLIGGPLRVALVTRHLRLKDVPKEIKRKKIIDTIELVHSFLTKYLHKRNPKIAVTSLNPHGGESGVLGNEEIKIIRPAVLKAKARYKTIYGPLPPDSVFYDAYRGIFDAVICMYHDQGLIPLKMIARDTGVNITLGLPFIRTSPAHGTAFNIAGKGIVAHSSMQEAIKLAATLLR